MRHVVHRRSLVHSIHPGRVGERSMEKRGAGSPCESFFSTVDDEFVPEIQAVYARVA